MFHSVIGLILIFFYHDYNNGSYLTNFANNSIDLIRKSPLNLNPSDKGVPVGLQDIIQSSGWFLLNSFSEIRDQARAPYC